MGFLPAGARRGTTAVLVAALFASLSVAPGDAGQRATKKQTELVVGAILDLARGWTSLGRGSRVTLQLAAADANAAFARSGSPLRGGPRSVDARGGPGPARRPRR